MAGNMFIKFTTPDIAGESTDSNNTNSIQVLSWSHSFNQPTSPTRSSAGSGTVEQANHSDFSFTKYTDSSTDDLLKYCWTGTQIGKAVFACYRSASTPVKYLEIEMTGVIVSNVSIGGGTGDVSTETVTLSYSSVKYTYIPQKTADGTGDGAQPIKHDLALQTVS